MCSQTGALRLPQLPLRPGVGKLGGETQSRLTRQTGSQGLSPPAAFLFRKVVGGSRGGVARSAPVSEIFVFALLKAFSPGPPSQAKAFCAPLEEGKILPVRLRCCISASGPHTHAYTCSCMYVAMACKYARAHIRMCAFMHVRYYGLYACTRARTYVCTYVCTYLCMHVCM